MGRDLVDEIRMAQVRAGEDVVIARLKRMGLIDEEGKICGPKEEKTDVLPFPHPTKE